MKLVSLLSNQQWSLMADPVVSNKTLHPRWGNLDIARFYIHFRYPAFYLINSYKIDLVCN